MAQLVDDDIAFPRVAEATPLIEPYENGIFFYLSTLLYAVPVVCFTGALFTDISYVKDPDIQWSNFSTWLLAFGILFLGLAIAVYALAYLITWSRPRNGLSWTFGILVVVAFVTGMLNNFIHSHDGWTAVWPVGITLSVITVALLFVALVIKAASLSNRYVVTES